MKKTKIIMGMPITVEILDAEDENVINEVFDYFKDVDERFSPYKKGSELSKVNRGLKKEQWSEDMREVLRLCEETRGMTHGYFNVNHGGKIDPSGLVKGWAIQNAADSLLNRNIKNFYIEAGGDIQAEGFNEEGNKWAVGIRSPFNIDEIIKVVNVSGKGVATSGTYIRGEHIYDPVAEHKSHNPVKSITVIGPDIYDADRYATAAFAMGISGISFIEHMPEFEAYMVDENKTATLTTGFNKYV